MTIRSRVTALVMGLVVVGLLAVLANYQLPYDTILWVEIQNTGHTPFFGLISLLLLGMSYQLLGQRLKRPQLHYLLALFGATALGLVSEYIQIEGPRDADVWDFVRDIAGAVVFLGLYYWWDNRHSARADRTRVPVLILSIVVLCASVLPLTLWSIAYVHRNSSFPVICNFDSYWSNKFLKAKEAKLEIVRPPAGWAEASSCVASVSFEPAHYSELVVRETCPDWSSFTMLYLDLYSSEDTTVPVKVRVEDRQHNGDFSDRYNGTFDLPPGAGRIEIPLDALKAAPAAREMDMSSIKAIHVFLAGVVRPLTLYIDDIRLE